MKRQQFHDKSPDSPQGSSKQKSKRKKIYYSNKNKKPKDNADYLNSIPLPLTNKFASLEEKIDDDDAATSAHNASKTKIAPIVVTNFDKDIQSIVAALQLSEQCDMKLVSVGRKIYTKSSEDKKKLIEALKSEKIDYFSHPDDEQKTFKAVLSGLPEVATSEITASLKSSHNITATKIIMFNTKSTSKLYLCHFQKSEVKMKLLNTIKTCYHHIIKWQPYKPSRKGPTQCYRCTLYGHGISQCMRYAVCSICNACTRITKDTPNPVYKCYNCATAELIAHNHKATDPDCPFRAKYENATKSARDKNKRTNKSTSFNAQNSANNNNNNNNDGNGNEHRYVRAPIPPQINTSYRHTHTTHKHTPTSSIITRSAKKSKRFTPNIK